MERSQFNKKSHIFLLNISVFDYFIFAKNSSAAVNIFFISANFANSIALVNSAHFQSLCSSDNVTFNSLSRALASQ